MLTVSLWKDSSFQSCFLITGPTSPIFTLFTEVEGDTIRIKFLGWNRHLGALGVNDVVLHWHTKREKEQTFLVSVVLTYRQRTSQILSQIWKVISYYFTVYQAINSYRAQGQKYVFNPPWPFRRVNCQFQSHTEMLKSFMLRTSKSMTFWQVCRRVWFCQIDVCAAAASDEEVCRFFEPLTFYCLCLSFFYLSFLYVIEIASIFKK